MSAPSVRRAGDRGLLIESADNQTVHNLAAAVRELWNAALEEVVPGHDTLLVVWREGSEPPADAESVLARLSSPGAAQEPAAATVTVPVHYDGPDIEAIAALAGIGPEELPEVHSTPTYQAAFVGFSPGFAYLLGGDPRLAVPRRTDPRVRVAKGSVAIAAGYTAIYPSDGPGGWHIIGHTDLRVFDTDRESPLLIEPGTRVIFERV